MTRRPREEELFFANLDEARPRARATGITVSGVEWPSLALSPDGRRAAVLEHGAIRVYEIDSKRLLAASALEDAYGFGSTYRVLFASSDRVLLAPRWYPNASMLLRHDRVQPPAGRVTMPLFELDVAGKRFGRTGAVAASTPTAFQPSPDGTLLLSSEISLRRVSLLDAKTGAAREGCVFDGWTRGGFLADGRIALLSWGKEGARAAIVSRSCATENEIPLPDIGGLSIAGEPEPGTLAIASPKAAGGLSETNLLLVDASTGSIRRLPGLVPALGWRSFYGGEAPFASPGARLFKTPAGALVSLDPKTGATRTVLAGGAP